MVTVQDPVCHMKVDPAINAITFEGLHYAFCYQQCRDRFESNQHLYDGTPAEQGPRPAGQHHIKCRHMHLECPIPKAKCRMVIEQLTSMMGVCKVEIRDNELAISYDLLEFTATQLEQALLATGTRLGNGWRERLKRAFIQYLEET